MQTISIEDFAARFDEVLTEVEAGERVVLARDDMPIVMLEPLPARADVHD